MPIKAASDKLIREMEMFGKDFENYDAPAEAEETVRNPSSPSDPLPLAAH